MELGARQFNGRHPLWEHLFWSARFHLAELVGHPSSSESECYTLPQQLYPTIVDALTLYGEEDETARKALCSPRTLRDYMDACITLESPPYTLRRVLKRFERDAGVRGHYDFSYTTLQ